jgi:phosphopantetheinyl transferase
MEHFNQDIEVSFMGDACIVTLKEGHALRFSEFERFFLPGELAELKVLRETRKADWILSRLATKFLLKRKIESLGNLTSWQQIEVKKGGSGVSVDIKTLPGHLVSVSISHSGGKYAAAALVAEDYASVGVDIESVRDFSDDLLLSFLTKDEYRYISLLCQTQRSIKATAMWSLKEAYFKANKSSSYRKPKEFETLEFMSGSSFLREPLKVKWTLLESNSILAEIQCRTNMI